MSDPLAAFPLSAIRVFEAAARLLSFTRAAEELGMTQAAVSWQVKALERRLDQPLFRRLPREVVLTPAGERLAQGASEAMGALRRAVADLSESGEGVLAITTLQTVAAQWLAPRLGGFQLASPKIAVRLEASARLADLSRDGFDVAIRAGSGDWADLEALPLFPAVITPLCAPQTLAGLGSPLSPEVLLTAPRIGLDEEWADWFAAAGVTSPDAASRAAPRFAADNQVFEVAAAIGGQGIALGSPILFAADIAAGRLVQPFDIVATIGGGYWLAYRRDRRRTRKIAAFRDWIVAAASADPAVARYAGAARSAASR
ncbi:LysR substrate-binding domain-containing protein [Phenylobacterium sp.]|uniref:LysR substrate-binding domain-containing protein n=1 Tax=Phenylobacterium sp. TaxID=1871053 RepID=UPI0035612FD1